MIFDNYSTVCFDFDGVVVESSYLKTAAYKSLFEKYCPEKIDAIMDYHLQNSGIVRYKKIKDICEKIIGMEYTAEVEKKMVAEYEDDIFRKVCECPEVPGAEKLLQNLKNSDKKIFIVSGTPDSELKKIIEARKLKKYFDGVYGGSKSKEFWLSKIICETNISNKEMIFIGDGLNDYEAARDCRVDFIFRITSENEYLKEKIIYLQLLKDYNNIIF